MARDYLPGPRGPYVIRSLVVSPFQENAYVLGHVDEKVCLFIDPGDEAERIANLAEEDGFKPLGILATHAHIDHVGAIAPLQDRYGLELWIHPEGQEWLDRLPEQARYFGLPPLRVPRVDHRLMAGGETELSIGPFAFELLYTPGHSPGHVSFALDLYAAGQGPHRGCTRAVLAGDCLFEGSIGRSDLPGGDYETLLESITEKLLPLGDETRVYSGHGPVTTIGQERRKNPFLLEWLASKKDEA